jgi:hypothetical protein
MVEVRHADADPAERRGAPQASTAEQIDSAARLPQMSAQLLRKDSIEPPGAESCRAVVLARRIERSLRGEAWRAHFITPLFTFRGEVISTNALNKAE